jgi:site-specific recombinase XerD
MIESPEKPKPYPQGVTVATVEKLLQSIESDTFLSRRDRAIIVFLWDTGVRASELCNLSMRDLNMGRREVLIRNGKGDKDRHVPFGLVVQKILENWLEVRGEANCDRVFVNRCRNPLTRSGVYDLLRRRKNEVGVEEPCNPHAFRHGFAIEFLENGGNIHNLQNLMGHETLRSTEIYLKATDRRARRDHRKASPGDHLNI